MRRGVTQIFDHKKAGRPEGRLKKKLIGKLNVNRNLLLTNIMNIIFEGGG